MRNLIAAFFMVSIFIHNSAFSVESDPPVTLKIVDFSPKFLKFYEKAKSENLQPDARWALWKKMVNFAAVPPTDAGQQLAREMLDNAWSRYPDAMEQISAGAPGMLPRPEDSLKSIVKLLKPVEKSEVTLITFVGAFDNNAFTSAGSGKSDCESGADHRHGHRQGSHRPPNRRSLPRASLRSQRRPSSTRDLGRSSHPSRWRSQPRPETALDLSGA